MVKVYSPGLYFKLLKTAGVSNGTFEDKYAVYNAMLESGFIPDSEVERDMNEELLARIIAGESEGNTKEDELKKMF